MPLVATRALVLQAFPYSDTSKILRLLSPDFGLRSVIAKGSQRARNRFSGLLEPFTEGEARFYLREGRDLHTLGGFDLLRSRQGIGRNLTAFAGASLMSELVLRFGTEEPHPALFEAISESLDRLVAVPTERAGHEALTGVWEIVAILGYQPHLDACVGCGRVIARDEPTRFDVEAGGVACTLCRPHGRVVDPATRAQIDEMIHARTPERPDLDWSLHRALLRAFLLAHLAPEHPLRSLDLFLELLR